MTTEKSFASYGERLGYAMLLEGVTSKELAERTKYTRQAISLWLRSDKAPQGSTPERLAEFLHVNKAWLVEGLGDPRPMAIPENLVREAAPAYTLLEETFPCVDPLVMGQAASALTNALSRLQISMADERKGAILLNLIRKAVVSGQQPTEAGAIEEILNP